MNKYKLNDERYLFDRLLKKAFKRLSVDWRSWKQYFMYFNLNGFPWERATNLKGNGRWKKR